ncbi:MAG TPA: ArsA family ATPase [Gemmatimonadaceae bacterium]
MSAFDALLDRLPRASLIVGKGGVGKTTCAVAVAAAFARRGEHTLVVSTDPAAALADVIGAAVGTAESSVIGETNLDARQLSAAQLRRDFLDRWRDTIAEIVDRGTYLDRADVDGLVDAALPGVDEIFALLALADLLADRSGRYARLVVDTAPTGHTLRLLALPETFSALLSMLDLMQDKHRFMVRALTHRYRRDRADDFIDEMRSRIDTLRAALADERSVAAVVVTRAEPVVETETRRYIEHLRDLHIRVAALIVNAVQNAGSTWRDADPAVPRIWVGRAIPPPRGIPSILRAFSAGTEAPVGVGVRDARRAPRAEKKSATIAARTLTIVGGKGGVGKSTVACALAVAAADDQAGPVLLVSTDPAPSIADALGEGDAPWARADVEHDVAGAPGLVVRQMDATAAFTRLRDEYQERIDGLFDALVGRGLDVQHDRAIVRDLLALAPPGIDELFALSLLGDALAERRFARIVVDPAPTGHLLRLLEMPALALDWSHRLMRLMLKYRDVVGLGETAQELLDFARRTRALDALIHDHAQCGLVVVALDEPVVRAETERLSAEVRSRGVDVMALLWNRVDRAPAPLPASVAGRQLFAQETSPPPIGVNALRKWRRSWRVLSPSL